MALAENRALTRRNTNTTHRRAGVIADGAKIYKDAFVGKNNTTGVLAPVGDTARLGTGYDVVGVALKEYPVGDEAGSVVAEYESGFEALIPHTGLTQSSVGTEVTLVDDESASDSGTEGGIGFATEFVSATEMWVNVAAGWAELTEGNSAP